MRTFFVFLGELIAMALGAIANFLAVIFYNLGHEAVRRIILAILAIFIGLSIYSFFERVKECVNEAREQSYRFQFGSQKSFFGLDLWEECTKSTFIELLIMIGLMIGASIIIFAVARRMIR